MPVIQFSIPTDVYLQLLDLARVTGLSEHQVAKYLTTAYLDIDTNVGATVAEAVLEQRRAYQRHNLDRKQRAKPLG